MRWTDLPPDRASADRAEAAARQRGEWQDLKQRLERLPAGHPSSPYDEAGADESGGAEAGADEHRAREAGAGADEAGGRRAGRGGRDRGAAAERPAGSGGPDAGPARGPRDPYQPWFAAGESPEPWFSADP